MICVFHFYVKTFMQSTFTYSINLLKPCMFHSSNDIVCLVGFGHPMNAIFQREDALNSFDKFMTLLRRLLDFFSVINF